MTVKDRRAICQNTKAFDQFKFFLNEHIQQYYFVITLSRIGQLIPIRLKRYKVAKKGFEVPGFEL